MRNDKKNDPKKGEERLHGPYLIIESITNGRVQIQQEKPMVQEAYNNRKLVPYRGPQAQTQNDGHMNFYQQQVQIVLMNFC